jgi:glucose-1-phosphate cytidylyltransferase
MEQKLTKVVILAGGFGTRISEYTDFIPKPMVKIGAYPIIWHIMNHYAYYGFKNFIIAAGYKSEVIKDYFLNYSSINSNFTVNLKNGQLKVHDNCNLDWNVTIVDTGLNTMTGGRLKRLKSLLSNDEKFLFTYGDGLSDVNIDKLVDFHDKNSKLVTLTTVHPSARFGELEIDNNSVKSFKEKPQTKKGWINGGFFVANTKFIDMIEKDETILESEPLENAAKSGQLNAFKHEGFWQCMDNIRDKQFLEELYFSKKYPWKLLNND